jgi:hypothetical protein
MDAEMPVQVNQLNGLFNRSHRCFHDGVRMSHERDH